MMPSTIRILSILKNGIFSQKINSFDSFTLYKYYIIIAIIIFSAASFLVFVPTFAESSLNSPLSIINTTEVEKFYYKANNFYNKQKYDEALQYYDKALAIEPSNVGALNGKALAFK